MALTNSQYDLLLQDYEKQQLKNNRIREAHKEEAYARIPALQELDQEVASLSLKKARILLGAGGEDRDFDLASALEDCSMQRTILLESNGFPKDYLEISYRCPTCQDTGFTEGRKCSCFRQKEIELLYEQSHIKDLLEEENFDTFCLDYYSDRPEEGQSESPRFFALEALESAHYFVRNFDKEMQNLFIYGNTGVGKTFLTHCIARELLNSGHSVLYLTAAEFFEILEKQTFSSNHREESAHSDLLDCDLLIIDDLGTEFRSSFTLSQLFVCINQRIIQQKSTVISSNLMPVRIADEYSERVSSRIISRYDMVPMTGKDIRIQKATL